MTCDDLNWPPTPSALRSRFDAPAPYTVGLEDELMLLDGETLELSPRAGELLAALDGDARFKLELPASQLEIVTPVCATVADAAQALLDARRALAGAGAGRFTFAAAGAHPFSSGIGALNRTLRYERTIAEYGAVASRQLVCALQVHVAPGSSGRALAVYNAARSYLPLIAALAANAPFYEGADTGLASVRPKLGELLPRQGVPPLVGSWTALAESFRWGARTGAVPDSRTWWWELRLHPLHGTLEFRVPDGQSSVTDAGVVAAVVQALVAWLGARHDAGEPLATHDTWRIEENRWSACRHGVEGTMADLDTGELESTRARLRALLHELRDEARRLGCAAELDAAAAMIECNGAIHQRRAAIAGGGSAAATRWLVSRFLAVDHG